MAAEKKNIVVFAHDQKNCAGVWTGDGKKNGSAIHLNTYLPAYRICLNNVHFYFSVSIIFFVVVIRHFHSFTYKRFFFSIHFFFSPG